MLDNTEREVEWCGGWEWFCRCEYQEGNPDTKCPDLGDWSEVPHDELEEPTYSVAVSNKWERMVREARISLDRDRLLSYIED